MAENTRADGRGDFAAKLNPSYGSGVFRRRIRLTADGMSVLGELEDSAHGFRCHLQHDGQHLTSIRGESLRTPYDICPGATEPIKQFVGQAINVSLQSLNTNINARSNCTHLYDLSALALQFCFVSHSEGRKERIIDVEIPDETDKPTTARVTIDGVEILAWQLQQWQIVGPSEIAGKPFHKGFASWVNESLSGLEQTAAFAIQKGYLVAESRRYDMDALAGTAAELPESMNGICYTYSRENVGNARRLSGTMRDFSDSEEQLLTFK
ncbi:MAG: DUF2889 domain-containing protein [Pseudomonadales bacterium]